MFANLIIEKNFSRKLKLYKTEPMKILELKNRKLKLRSQQFNIRLITAKERIRELEGRSKEYISCKTKRDEEMENKGEHRSHIGKLESQMRDGRGWQKQYLKP